MPVLRDPVVTLEDIRLRKITLSSLDLELSVRVDSPNLLGVPCGNTRLRYCAVPAGQSSSWLPEIPAA